MNALLGSEALPGTLPRLMEPWARALIDAGPSNSHWLREATEIGSTRLTDWVILTPEIAASLRDARATAVRLAHALDRQNEAAALSAKDDARSAFQSLMAALLMARPTERKAALGHGW